MNLFAQDASVETYFEDELFASSTRRAQIYEVQMKATNGPYLEGAQYFADATGLGREADFASTWISDGFDAAKSWPAALKMSARLATR